MIQRKKRSYHSEVRVHRAAATRAAIVAAGRTLVVEHGLVGTTLQTVAKAARVSLPTVYAVFGSKSALFRAMIFDVKREIELGASFAAMLETKDPMERLRLAAAVTRSYSELGGPTLDAVRFGAAHDAELAQVWASVEGDRYVGQTRLVQAIAADTGLRPGLSVQAAADQMWTLTAHDTYRLLVGDRGWSPRRFERWLVETLAALLLLEPAS